MSKIGSTRFLDPKKPKRDLKTTKNCQSVDTVTHLEEWLQTDFFGSFLLIFGLFGI